MPHKELIESLAGAGFLMRSSQRALQIATTGFRQRGPKSQMTPVR